MLLTASPAVFPWPSSTSTWRSFATTSSGVYRLFGIGSSFLSTHSKGGSVLWGQVSLMIATFMECIGREPFLRLTQEVGEWFRPEDEPPQYANSNAVQFPIRH